MTRAERHALLGDEIVAHIHDLVRQAPEPDDELVDKLRRIMTNPAGHVPAPRPAADAA